MMRIFRHRTGLRLAFHALGNILDHTVSKNRVLVINYHRVLAEPDQLLPSEPDIIAFRWQMKLLSDWFNVLSMSDAIKAVKKGKVPKRAVCITFDDGYRAVHELALPVLRELNLPATVFVTSGFIGQGSMWNDRIITAIQMMPAGELDLSEVGLGVYPLNNLADRKNSMELLIERSKYLPPTERGMLVERLGLSSTETMEEGPMLTSEMIVDLDQHGIEIGAHTVTHPILTSLDDDDARQEIVGGKLQLEAILQKKVRFFAYPNGKFGKDYNMRHVSMVQEAGYEAAFTTAIGTMRQESDVYQLPRSRPWDTSPLRFGIRLLHWLAQGR